MITLKELASKVTVKFSYIVFYKTKGAESKIKHEFNGESFKELEESLKILPQDLITDLSVNVEIAHYSEKLTFIVQFKNWKYEGGNPNPIQNLIDFSTIIPRLEQYLVPDVSNL